MDKPKLTRIAIQKKNEPYRSWTYINLSEVLTIQDLNVFIRLKYLQKDGPPFYEIEENELIVKIWELTMELPITLCNDKVVFKKLIQWPEHIASIKPYSILEFKTNTVLNPYKLGLPD